MRKSARVAKTSLKDQQITNLVAMNSQLEALNKQKDDTIIQLRAGNKNALEDKHKAIMEAYDYQRIAEILVQMIAATVSPLEFLKEFGEACIDRGLSPIQMLPVASRIIQSGYTNKIKDMIESIHQEEGRDKDNSFSGLDEMIQGR